MTMRRNPYGMPLAQPVRGFSLPHSELPRIIRVGKRGVHTHIYDPELEVRDASGHVVAKGAPLCGSGYKGSMNQDTNTWQRAVPVLYATGVKRSGLPSGRQAHYVTCLRCVKLSRMNIARYKSLLPPDAERR